MERRSARRPWRGSPPGASGAFAHAGQHEKHIGEPVQPGQEVLTRDVALVDALHDAPLRPASDRAGVVQARGEPVLARNDEASLDRRALFERLKHLVESRDGRAVESFGQTAEISPGRRDLRHDKIQATLKREELSAEARPRRERSREPQDGLRLVEVAERLDAVIGLANSLLSEERGLAAVAGAGGDAGRGPSRAGGHVRQSGRSGHAMLDRSREASRGVYGGTDAFGSRRRQRQEQEKEVQRAARARAEAEGRGATGPAHDLRDREAETERKRELVTRHSGKNGGERGGAGVKQAGAVVFASAKEQKVAVTEKSRAIEQAIQQIEKQFGKGSIMKLGANTGEKIDVISTGSLAVDMALGVGGFPRGRVVEIYGPEASGKTTLALHAVASAQKTGGTPPVLDPQHAL